MKEERIHPIDPDSPYFNSPHWNGQPCEAQLGSVVVTKEVKPTWWSAPYAGKRIPCIKITAADNPEGDMKKGSETFFIFAESRGIMKVLFEGGGMMSGHASVTVDDPDTFIPVKNFEAAPY